MQQQASVQLYMLRTESMILQARSALHIDISDESVEDIGRIDQLTASLEQRSASDLESVRAKWDEIIEAIRDRRKVAWILLSSTIPVDLDSDALTVQFRRDPDAKGFITTGCDRDLRIVLAEITHLVRRIRATSPEGVIHESERESERGGSFTAGDLVNHEGYGLGRVISVEGTNDDPEVKVDFGKEYGIKHLLLRYAPVHRL